MAQKVPFSHLGTLTCRSKPTQSCPKQLPAPARTRRTLFLRVLSLCLSRACLGKKIIFSIKWHRKRCVFLPPPPFESSRDPARAVKPSAPSGAGSRRGSLLRRSFLRARCRDAARTARSARGAAAPPRSACPYRALAAGWRHRAGCASVLPLAALIAHQRPLSAATPATFR